MYISEAICWDLDFESHKTLENETEHKGTSTIKDYCEDIYAQSFLPS